ncbi:MAG: hypothetical protein SFW07_04885 [Gammaproteobacteria bacterium]|nr:hypothetical protein [Gammaproteobacteria bacterium]
MAFELFDLNYVLRIHNQIHPRQKVDTNSTFGLRIFSPEFNDFLSKGFELYHNAYYLHKGFEGKRIREYQAQLANSGSISALKKLVSQRAADGKATNSFLLREKIGKASSSLNEGFAHYTHCALLEAYDYLRTLESTFLYTEKELKRARFRLFSRVPQHVVIQYRQYLQKQRSLVHKEYRKLARAMVSRLTLASQDPSLQHGDILFHEDLHGLIEDKLTQSNFQDFYGVIKSCGDSETKKQLSKLPWVAMANQLSANPSLCKPSTIYNLAKVVITSRHMRAEAKKADSSEERLKAELNLADEAQKIIKEEESNFGKRKAFFGKWWRRFFSKNNLNHLSKIRQFLKKQAEYIQRHKAVIQSKLAVINTPPNPKITESLVPKNTAYAEYLLKPLEDLLLGSLVSRFGLSKESLEYLMRLKEQMLEQNIVNVSELPDLTITDKVFLGLNQKNFFSHFVEDDRKIISLTLNMIVLLSKEKKVIEKMSKSADQEIRVQKITSDIYRYLEKYGTSETQEIIKKRVNHVRAN